MAGKGTIGGKIVLEGESEYRSALRNIKTEQAELRSEMKLCQSAFKENQNSIEALSKKHEVLTKQIDSQNKKISVYEKALQTAHEAEEKAVKKISDLRTALQGAEKEMTEMRQSAGESSEALKEQSEHVEELKKKLALAEQDYDKVTQKTASYQTAINYANIELQGMQLALDNTEKYMKEAENSMNGCAVSLDKYGQETETAADKTSVLGDVLKANLLSDAIRSGIKALAEGIKKIAVASVDTGSSFEAAMSQVAATMGMTTDEVDNGCEAYTLLANAAEESGKATMFSASESAQALNYLALAGYDAEKSAATLPKTLDLAAAGGLDLAYATDLVTDSMAALGLETDQLDTYIDEMARTSQKSNTSVAQLGEATLVCAGTVSLTNQSLETMNTELGILANNGYKGAEGGTHLRNILISLSAPTDKAAIALNDLGIAVSDSQGNMRDLNDIMIDLNAAMAGMSSTEKTQLISKIFNKTDISAVNALLKGTGDEFNTLYQEIQNSSGAASAMAETLNNNLKGKITILQSALEGLGISTYKIFDDEMKSSVESATDAVGRLQKAMDSGDLGVSMKKFSMSLAELVKGAVEFGEDALPIVIDGLTWMINNSDVIIAGVTGITAATVYHGTVAPMISAVTAAWNTYKTANEGATVSQWLLNAAMDANPAGILLTALVGLTAAVSAYVIINKDNLATTDETTKATRELVQASKELNESYVAASEERKTARGAMETEGTVCKKLVQELTGLQIKTSLTTQEQIRQKAIIGELNQALPELNLVIDEQTGLLNMSTEELERNVDALMAQAKAEAAREDLVHIAEEQYEAEKQLAELEEQRAEQIEQVNNAQNEYNEALAEANALYGGQTELYGTMGMAEAAALEQAKNAQAELEEQIAATQSTIDGFTAEYEETLAYISDTEPVSNASDAIGDLGEAAAGAGSDISGMSEKTQQAFVDMYESVSESITNQMNLFEEWDAKMVTSGEGMVANMQSQVDGLQSWADNIQELADRGINQGLLQKLADMGPEGAGYVAAFVDMTDEELAKANELYAESLTLSDDVAAQVAESYASVAENAVLGMTDKISESGESIEEAGTAMGKVLHTATENQLEIKSPSKKYKEIGKFTIQGLIEGIKGEQANALNTIENLARSMVTRTQSQLQVSTFAEIGKQIPNGLIMGINSGRSGVVKAIQDMCTQAVESAKASLDIHSPSKKFAYLGKMSGEGYQQGWNESMNNINAVIASAMPEYNLTYRESNPTVSAETTKDINIVQHIHIEGSDSNMIETSRKFKQWQREVAKDW